MFEVFHYPFVQHGAVEVLLLAVGAGLLGTWIVLRGLAFYAHAVATATFPGLVLAAGVGFSAPLGALGAALVFAVGIERLARARGGRGGHDSFTALVLVGALALGVILASDVFHSGSQIGSLLFGSLLTVSTQDVVLAGVGSAVVVVAAVVLGRRWLAVGFDAGSARSLGVRSPLPDAILLGLVAIAVTSALATSGALLATALYVVPAATTRLWTTRLRCWQAATIALAAVEGVGGLWLSVETNVPPGAGIAVLTGTTFALAALVRTAGIRRPALVAAAVAGTVLLTGCGGARSGAGFDVVATTTQIADWAREVGGTHVAVHQILQPNTDPHEYVPRPNDVIATARAAVVLESGDGLDSWMGTVTADAGGSPTIVDLGSYAPVTLTGPDGAVNPHWWLEPANAAAAVRVIRDVFAAADPAHAGAYRENAGAYLASLSRLDHAIGACLGAVQVAERRLVTDHDAFGYFARRYGIQVVGAVIPSQTKQAEPSAGETARLIALIEREHVRAIFPESSLNQRLAQTIAAQTGADATHTLYGDTLGPSGSTGATYLLMQQANATAMAEGFTGHPASCEAAS